MNIVLNLMQEYKKYLQFYTFVYIIQILNKIRRLTNV